MNWMPVHLLAIFGLAFVLILVGPQIYGFLLLGMVLAFLATFIVLAVQSSAGPESGHVVLHAGQRAKEILKNETP